MDAPSKRASAAGPAVDKILVVDDDPATIQLMGRILAGIAQVRFATSGESALAMVREARPDLILLDADMPGMGGFAACRALKGDPAVADVPVIFVTSFNELSFELQGFEAGAADFIAKPVSPPIVQARVRMQLRMKRMADELRRLTVTDSLTGVANRRYLDEVLEREWLRARRTLEPLSLLLVDVDHFKLFNDRLGHPAGDACLRALAEAMSGATHRTSDVVARYGGEEFAVLLPETPLAGAEVVARRLLASVAALRIAHPASPTAPNVTISIGVAVAQPPAPIADEVRALVDAADRALYDVKRHGRGRARRIVLGRDLSSEACGPVPRATAHGPGDGTTSTSGEAP